MRLMSTGWRERWAVAIAALFCVYSVALLINAFHDRDQLRQAALKRLVADSQRRGIALGDIAYDRFHVAQHLAELNELNTYLTSKALGMSPQYGLGVSLDALERRLKSSTERGDQASSHLLQFARVLIFDETAQLLADSDAGVAVPVGLIAGSDPTTAKPSIALSQSGDYLVTRVPVMFKDTLKGTLVDLTDIGELYQQMIQLESINGYRETLVTPEGRELVPAGRSALFSPALARSIVALPESQPTPLSDLSAAGALKSAVAIVTPVAAMPFRLVTTEPLSTIEGSWSSGAFLYSMAVFPAFLLLLAVRFNRLQSRNELLRLEAIRAEAQRRSLQDRNELMSEDIRRRELLEAELKAHRERLEELVEQRTAELARLFHALPDLYFRAASDGTILECRAGRTEDLLMPPDQLLGQRMQDVLPGDTGVMFQQALNQIGLGTDQLVIEYELPLERGPQHFEARLLPLGSDQVVVVVRNVTDRHEIESARELNRLETERLARVKTEFLTNMSHEIRTPLNAVLGLAQVGARSTSDPTVQASFKPIEDAGRHLLAIVNDILDFSKLAAGKLSVEKRAFELAGVVQNAASLVLGRIEAKGLELVVDIAPGLPDWVEGDELRLKQVLVNLLSNAVKFTEAGRITLGVVADDRDVVFSVTDTGIGISDEQLTRLFKPFQQADLSTTRRFGGTGLGLTISHDLARLMGGSITVHSQLGQGASFVLRLPLPAAAAPDHEPSPSSGQRLRGLRLLAAEDNEVNCMVLQSMLDLEGAQVVFVANGLEAVNAMKALRQGGPGFDAVLMDVQMPVMDGLEATRRILALNLGVPVIGLTAHALPEERERCSAAGMVAHLAKPVELDELVAVVQRCVAGHRAKPTIP
jgi:signal transduction histidine kinase/CheY-like chemotaxis protein